MARVKSHNTTSEEMKNPSTSNPANRMLAHTEYAEDQPYARTILTGHVLHRGFQTGVFVGTFITIIRSSVAIARGTTSIAALNTFFLPQLQRSAGIVGLCSFGALGLALMGKMRNAEEIEWKDRTWRLLENEGQVECDKWAVAGSMLGVGALGYAAVKGHFPIAALQNKATPWLRIVGSAGLGNAAGVIGYLVWRKAVRGNKKAS